MASRTSAHYLQFGASPRASIHMIEGARALAFPARAQYVLPEDVTDMAPDVLRHRLVLTYEAHAAGLTADALVLKVMQHIQCARQAARKPCPRRGGILTRSCAGSSGR
jgi:MoxR-like ATPase